MELSYGPVSSMNQPASSTVRKRDQMSQNKGGKAGFSQIVEHYYRSNQGIPIQNQGLSYQRA
jgi:hypothetical protein